MSTLLEKVNSSICKIDSCISSAAAHVVKSATYGRDEAELDYSQKLETISFIKNRLTRYRDTFLTNNCWPNLCSEDPCLNDIDVCSTDFVDMNSTGYFLESGASVLERINYTVYNPDTGKSITMTKADDNGELPSSLVRMRFYEWGTCDNSFVPVSSYIDMPNTFANYFIYVPSEKKYYVIGSDWIIVLDFEFTLLNTYNYGGSRSWRGMTYDETRQEFYLIDNLGQEVDIMDYTTMTITSTTALPAGTPTSYVRPRVAAYKGGGLLIMGWTKVWHMDVATQAVTLVIDGDGTDYYYGTPVLNQDGEIYSLVTDIVNSKINLQKWYVDSSVAFLSGPQIDLDLTFTTSASTPSLKNMIEFDSCGNLYFYAGVGTILTNYELLAFYDKNLVKQYSYTGDFNSYGQESPFSSFYNPSSNKYYIQSSSVTYRMLVFDIDKCTRKKVSIYPEMCTPLTEDDVCDIMNKADKICESICK